MVYKRIRDLREDMDWTQKQMADYLKCSQRIYSNYERGEVRIPPDVLVELSKLYRTSIDYLLDLTDEKEPYPRQEEK